MKNAARLIVRITQHISHNTQRIFLFIVLFLIGATFCSSSIFRFLGVSHAQSYNGSSISDERFYQSTESNVPNTFSTYSQAAIIGLGNATLCILAGIDLTNPERGCLVYKPVSQKLGYAPQTTDGKPIATGGLLTVAGGMIDMVYTKPISTGQYTSYLADKFGIAKTANAQQHSPLAEPQDTRSGFEGLQSVLLLFIAVRNVVYILLVLAFVIVGLGIMLRVNIDPRTVMTIQNQIPKLVIAIITVTFSYAIAGLLIDTMWVFTYFGINTISQASPTCGGTGGLQFVATANILNNPLTFVQDIFSDTDCFGGWENEGIHGIAGNAALTISDALSRSVLELLSLDAGQIGECDPGLLKPDVGDCLRYGAFWIIKYFLALIFIIVLFIAIIIALMKTWFMLLKAYISILLGVIIAPLWIIVGVLPGGGLGFGQWMRHMVAHLAIFPAAALLYAMAAMIASSEAANNPRGAFLPPLIGNPNVADNMGWLIALGFILLTPDLLNIIRDALKTPQGKYTGNIFGRAKQGNPLTTVTALGGFGYSLGGISTLTNKLPFLKKGAAGVAGGT